MNGEKERKTVYFDAETWDLLQLYRWHFKLRSENTAAVMIVSDFLKEWKQSID